MKNYIFILLLIFSVSCQETKDSTRSDQVRVIDKEVPSEDIQEESAAVENSEEAEENKDVPEPIVAMNGRYRKVVKDKATGDCNCQCVDIDFDKATEWCIIKDKVYISARCQKTGENSADLYFVNAVRDENGERSIPWKEFDTGTPIASINFQPDGTAEVDWIGFSVNGEVATDYAIYGKKTLEGTYKKE